MSATASSALRDVGAPWAGNILGWPRREMGGALETLALQAALEERDVLLHEVHHRFKNNLQVLASLISMQARSLGEGPSRDALVECQARVQAMALVHQELYRTKDCARTRLGEYARSLARNVFHAAGAADGISLELAVEDVDVAVEKAVPCGLILNELITNALKHAFPDGRRGTVRVEAAPEDGVGVRLAVIDDGVGLPPGIDVRRSGSLGLQLVWMLAEQLAARLEVKRGSGTHVALTVPHEE